MLQGWGLEGWGLGLAEGAKYFFLGGETPTNPVLPFPFFFLFLARNSFFLLSVFPFFCGDFRGSVGIQNPCFLVVFLAFFQQKKERIEGWGLPFVQMALQTEKNYFRINYVFHCRYRYRRELFWNSFLAADTKTAVLCSLEGGGA